MAMSAVAQLRSLPAHLLQDYTTTANNMNLHRWYTQYNATDYLKDDQDLKICKIILRTMFRIIASLFERICFLITIKNYFTTKMLILLNIYIYINIYFLYKKRHEES